MTATTRTASEAPRVTEEGCTDVLDEDLPPPAHRPHPNLRRIRRDIRRTSPQDAAADQDGTTTQAGRKQEQPPAHPLRRQEHEEASGNGRGFSADECSTATHGDITIRGGAATDGDVVGCDGWGWVCWHVDGGADGADEDADDDGSDDGSGDGKRDDGDGSSCDDDGQRRRPTHRCPETPPPPPPDAGGRRGRRTRRRGRAARRLGRGSGEETRTPDKH